MWGPLSIVSRDYGPHSICVWFGVPLLTTTPFWNGWFLPRVKETCLATAAMRVQGWKSSLFFRMAWLLAPVLQGFSFKNTNTNKPPVSTVSDHGLAEGVRGSLSMSSSEIIGYGNFPHKWYSHSSKRTLTLFWKLIRVFEIGKRVRPGSSLLIYAQLMLSSKFYHWCSSQTAIQRARWGACLSSPFSSFKTLYCCCRCPARMRACLHPSPTWGVRHCCSSLFLFCTLQDVPKNLWRSLSSSFTCICVYVFVCVCMSMLCVCLCCVSVYVV